MARVKKDIPSRVDLGADDVTWSEPVPEEVIRPLPKKALTNGAKKHLDAIAAALPDADVISVEKGLVQRLENHFEGKEAPHYEDADDEWAGARFVQEEPAALRVMHKFNAGEKGISGQTDLTPNQAVLLTHFRVLTENYPEEVYHLGLDKFPEWFETYRLSIGRGSRKEATDIYRGNVPINPEPGSILGSTPTKGRF